MKSVFRVDINSHIPIYKQLLASYEQAYDRGNLQAGECLPSMNELAAQFSISKETAKKVYSILRERGLVESMHGKGFFVTPRREERKLKVFMMLDKLSQFKQILYDAFIQEIGNRAEIAIYLYNQNIDTFEEFIDQALNKYYDYYLITPHFHFEPEIQSRAFNALKRIPNRKLILLDKEIRSLPGNYGVICQDYANDIYTALGPCLDELRKFKKIHAVTLPTTIYGSLITKSLSQFCNDNNLVLEFHDGVTDDMVHEGGLYVVLNGQLDMGLVDLARISDEKGLEIGKDMGIITYNDSYLSDIVLGGLTTVSTDFKQMGRLAAEMVLTNNLRKVHCDFRLNRRKTF